METTDLVSEILKPIGDLPGISGYLLCGSGGNIIASTLPPIYETHTVKQLNQLVIQSYEVFKINGQQADELIFQYEDGKLIVKAYTHGYLMVLAVKELNYAVFGLSAKLALKKLEDQRERLEKYAKVANIAESASKKLVAQEVLQQIKKSLALQIGPMANLIFKKSLIFPVDSFPEHALDACVQEMAEAITDEKKRKKFLDDTAKYYSS